MSELSSEELGAASSSMEPSPGEAVCTREIQSFEQLQEAGELYARVFGYRDPQLSLNPYLLSAIVSNGGSAVGAFGTDDRMVGFAYGFAGRDADGRDFHYSQASLVDPDRQGCSIGRLLKLKQREVAERWGHQSMRWAFDPMLARNGHFNLSSLGAVGVAFRPDYYGRSGTDRLLVEWSLQTTEDLYGETRKREAPELTREDWGRVTWCDSAAWVALPAHPGTRGTESMRSAVTEALAGLMAEGFVLVGCHRTGSGTAAYLAVPHTDRTDEGKS